MSARLIPFRRPSAPDGTTDASPAGAAPVEVLPPIEGRPTHRPILPAWARDRKQARDGP